MEENHRHSWIATLLKSTGAPWYASGSSISGREWSVLSKQLRMNRLKIASFVIDALVCKCNGDDNAGKVEEIGNSAVSIVS
ncbi:unnamed protein product [Clonostachys rosea f. rosea IK726]|uniref:Uncharacterized protein n=1 Tax=Clonostachys rosea f. rosea IK726 TaxID=1349383 RepID=A0ACA9TQ95_BIOOC|nr:unnamed protein product [Clonostachys rosea f. rosea IK726]